MSIKVIANQNITKELLAHTIKLLSTISGDIGDEVLSTMALEEVKKYSLDLKYNNDLGICVERIIYSSDLFDNTQMSEDEIYANARKDDGLIDQMIHETAFRLASTLSPILYTLKSDIHDATESLVNQINTMAVDPSLIEQRQTTAFAWGDLRDSAFAQASILIAREDTNTMKSNVATQYDCSNILDKLPVKMITDMGRDIRPAIQAKLMDAVKDTPMTEEAVTAYVNLLTNKNAYIVWNDGVKISMTHGKGDLAKDLITTLTEFSKFHKLDDALSALASLDIGSKSEETLRQNQMALRNSIYLGSAAALYHKNEFKNKLIMTEEYINADAIPASEKLNVTQADIVAYIRYATEISKIGIPNLGVSIEKIIEMKEPYIKAVESFDEKRKVDGDLQQRMLLQKALSKVLNSHHMTAEMPDNTTEMTYHDRHNISLHKALASAGLENVSLYSVVTDYLVRMNGNRNLQTIYEKLDKALVEHVSSNEGEVQSVNPIICQVAMNTICEFIAQNYSETAPTAKAA